MHSPAALDFIPFGPKDPLATIAQSRQRDYLIGYLATLGAAVVIREPNYFDRDYLSECSAFYASAARGYPNICERLHFFSSAEIDRPLLTLAAADDKSAKALLNKHYLGFIVLRPIDGARFGRTVLKWFDDSESTYPRVTTPSRKYTAHIAGVRLKVKGLAWQQQDKGVSACATIGLWTTLHSSAFDIRHAVPTTFDITSGAHSGAPMGNRMFPSMSLPEPQLLEAIKNQGLAPMALYGDLKEDDDLRFSPEYFKSTCAALIRNGFPVLLAGTNSAHHKESEEAHVMCVVGYRRADEPISVPAHKYVYADTNIEHLYVHDDNIGPSVRFRIEAQHTTPDEEPPNTYVTLRHDPPNYVALPDYVQKSGVGNSLDEEFYPEAIFVAVHDDIRLEVHRLHELAGGFAKKISEIMKPYYEEADVAETGLVCTFNLMTLTHYFRKTLKETLGTDRTLLAKTRLALHETVPPMSRYIGVVRISLPQAESELLVDILLDTTDSRVNNLAFAHVLYDEKLDEMLQPAGHEIREPLGYAVRAFQSP